MNSQETSKKWSRFTPGFDLLVGLLVTFRVISMAIGQEQDTTTVLLTAFVLFFMTGLLFSSQESGVLLRRGLYILLPIALISGAQSFANATPIYFLLVLFSLLGCAGGLVGRFLWQKSGWRQGSLFLAALLALTLVLNAVVVPKFLQKMITIEENASLHDFEVSLNDSTVVSSRDMLGTVTIMVFWNTWCTPCLDQLPEIDKVRDIYATNPSVRFLAVNTNWRGDSRKKVDRFLEQFPLDMTVVYDSGARITETMGVAAVPHVVLIDKKGRLRYRLVGSPGEGGIIKEALLEYISRLLREEE